MCDQIVTRFSKTLSYSVNQNLQMYYLYCLLNFQVELSFQACQIDRANVQADLTQPLFTCSSLTVEAPEQCVKSGQS